MSLKGNLRAIEAAGRRAERDARRRQRELDQAAKAQYKLIEMTTALIEHEEYQNWIDVITSIHSECTNDLDWKKIASASPPLEPKELHSRETQARNTLRAYSPSFFERLLRKDVKKTEEFEIAINTAIKADAKEFFDLTSKYKSDLEGWQATKDLAQRILSEDLDAYLEATIASGSFDEISEIGSSVNFKCLDTARIEATIQVKSDDIIPKETKTILKSGKLSVKAMPKIRFHALYQDCVCGCVLRIARELFALLPIDMAIVTAVGEILNTKTGHLELRPILSAAIPRTTVDKLNFATLDPSDSMANFVHNMNFRKTSGFRAVEKIDSRSLI